MRIRSGAERTRPVLGSAHPGAGHRAQTETCAPACRRSAIWLTAHPNQPATTRHSPSPQGHATVTHLRKAGDAGQNNSGGGTGSPSSLCSLLEARMGPWGHREWK